MAHNQTIYIFCPANLQSGGPEALHQLAYYMEQVQLRAYIVYFNCQDNIDPMPERYKIYQTKRKSIDEIEDTEQNILLAPESSSSMLNGYKHIRKYIWWLSVNHYDNPPTKKIKIIKSWIKIALGLKKRVPKICDFRLKDCIHVCGSMYAYTFVRKLGIKNALYLVEPISKEFLDYQPTERMDRNDIILYNPAKPSETMTHLLEEGRFKFQPLSGLSPDELIKTYQHAKLYIDFGHFGGPERIPKEAVFFGCAILVGKRNAAANNFDVAIPDDYKIEDYNNLEIVNSKIEFILQNQASIANDFGTFKQKIEKLESNFKQQIFDIFSPEK